MDGADLIRLFVAPLEAADVPYMVTGGVAAVIYGTGLWVAPPEYVILRKLQYWEASGSDRYLRDIAAILEISEEAVDRSVLAD